MKALRVIGGAGVWLLVALCVHAQGQGATGSIFTCVDAYGRKLTSDRPIPACLDRQQRELAPSGSTRRVVGPSLSEHEYAEKEAIARKEQDARDRIADARRREKMLVARYPDQAAHNVERNAALATVDALTDLARKRKSELVEQREALLQEMEFYQLDPAKAPIKLQRQIAQNEIETQEQQRSIETQLQDKGRIHQRFDKELVNLRSLWAARNMVPGAVPGAETAAR